MVVRYLLEKKKKSFGNFENVYKNDVFPRSIDVAMYRFISGSVEFQKSKIFPVLLFRYAEGNFQNPWVQNP